MPVKNEGIEIILDELKLYTKLRWILLVSLMILYVFLWGNRFVRKAYLYLHHFTLYF